MAETWPFKLPFAATNFALVNTRRSGGVSVGGSEQITMSPGARWQATATLQVTTRGPRGADRTLAFRALYAALSMGADIEVPVIMPHRPVDAFGRMAPVTIQSGIDGLSLYDHSGLAADVDQTFFMDAPGALRDTRLRLRHPGVEPLRPGHFIGIKDRLHIVARAWVLNWERVGAPSNMAFWGDEPFLWLDGDTTVWGESESGGVAGQNILRVDIWPPLREQVGIGEPLILGRPVCKMRMSGSGPGIDYSAGGGAQAPQITFDEVL